MEDEKRYTEAEAHRRFAIQFHGRTWDLLDKVGRTSEDDDRMVHLAHASLSHWLEVGTELHHQRGEWLLARVYAVLGRSQEAQRHGRRCLALTEANPSLMADFDVAFAYEAMARTSALAGQREEMARFYARAEEAGREIADEQDRRYFLGDLAGGDWYGLR